MAPLEYIGRYMKGWWDYAIADELHQLAQETAQGNNLGVLYRCARRLIALTGTLMGGYADDRFNIFYRMEPRQMVAEGFAAGSAGRRDFATRYGVMESIEKILDQDNACTGTAKAMSGWCGSQELHRWSSARSSWPRRRSSRLTILPTTSRPMKRASSRSRWTRRSAARTSMSRGTFGKQ
jgi:hypothetical protein